MAIEVVPCYATRRRQVVALSSVPRIATLREDSREQANIEVGVVPYVTYRPSLARIVISIASSYCGV